MTTWDMEPPDGAPDMAAVFQEEEARVEDQAGAAAIPKHSEEAMALRFSAQYSDDLRYVAAWGKWMIWDGKSWRPDDTLVVFNLVRAVCRGAAPECTQKDATRLCQGATVAAVERLARADRRHAATVNQWDADPWLLNTPAGVINLRTGKLRPADRSDYMTKITAASPGGDCPLWRQFLDRVTGGDPLLRAFMQRLCGYALTGSTEEHALFFFYGSGANGKSVFLQTLLGLLRDYARNAPIETFIASKNEHHPTDVAGLQGARLVTAIETEEGRYWSEAKLKSLTGGDTIAARFMRQDYFQFTPVFKLLLAGNHKPGLRSVDEAIRRRLNLVPFTVTIPREERDPKLAAKLRVEWGGILQWMIEGCMDWQRDGLNAPAAVQDATDEYLTSEDSLARWIEDCCHTPTGYCWTATKALFQSWSDWCEQNNEHPGSQRRFTQALEARGYESQRTSAARGFKGVELREDR